MTEGPYWIDESLTRRDVTEGMHGVPLVLRLSVVRASTCRPIKNADVEIWHAAPDGEYSGVRRLLEHALPARPPAAPTPPAASASTRSSRAGTTGRTPHIHLKVHVGGDEVHTGQLFMSEKVARAVYRTRYYKRRAARPTPRTRRT